MSTTVVNLRHKTCDVRIDRKTPWGNPFTHLPLGHTKALTEVATREEAIVAYENWVRESDDPEAVWIRENVRYLAGKTLGCWCAPLPCHGEVLARLADGA